MEGTVENEVLMQSDDAEFNFQVKETLRAVAI